MKAIEKLLEKNRNQAISLMKENNAKYVSFFNEDGETFLDEIPCIKAVNGMGVVFSANVKAVMYDNNRLQFKLHNDVILDDDMCLGCTANAVYEGIKTHFYCYCDLHSKLSILNKAIIREYKQLVPKDTELNCIEGISEPYEFSPFSHEGIKRMKISSIKNDNGYISFSEDYTNREYNMTDFAVTDLMDILYHFGRVKYANNLSHE